MIRYALLAILIFFMADSVSARQTDCSEVLTLPPGFDCEVFLDTNANLSLPGLMVFDSADNLYIGSNALTAAVAKVLPDRTIVLSQRFADPDGVAVTAMDEIFVAGGSGIFIVKSFDPNIQDQTFATGFRNIDALAISSRGDIAVLDNELSVSVSTLDSGNFSTIHTISGSAFSSDLEYDRDNNLYVSASNPGQLIKIDTMGVAAMIIPPDPLLDPGLGALAFARGGAFDEDLYITLLVGDTRPIKRLDTNGNLQDFAMSTEQLGGIAFDSAGNMYLSEFTDPGRIFRVFPTPTSVQDKTVRAITEYKISQNYPNPFNPNTTISFEIPKSEDIILAVYNVRGQLVKTLYSGMATAGGYQVVWDGTDTRNVQVASGIYLCKLQSQNFVATKKLILAK